MASQVQNMTSGSPLRHILVFSLPLMVGNLFQQLYTAVDSIIVGQGVGVNALAALGASDWIYWLFLWSIHGFTQGLSVLVAQAFGSGDSRRLCKTAASSVVLSFVFAVCLTVLSLTLIPLLLQILHTPDELISGARLYLTVLSLGHIIVVAFNMASGILRALGNSRLPLIALVMASCLNIGLDMLFVLYLHFGIVGAAIATLIAQLFAFFICAHGILHIPALTFRRSDWKASLSEYKTMCAFALPLSFQNSMMAVGGMFVQSALNNLGVVYIAAFTASNKLNAILECVAAAFGNGLSTYMGQNRGAGKIQRLDQGIRAVLLLAVLFSVTIGGGMILCGRYILRLFISASDANAAEILAVAYHYLVILCLGLLALFLVHLYRNALQGLGSVVGPVVSGFMELVLRIGVVLLIPLLGQGVIFYTETATWVGTALELVLAYYLTIGTIKRRMAEENQAAQQYESSY